MQETTKSNLKNDQALWSALEYAISSKKKSAIKPVLKLIPEIKNLNVQNPEKNGCSFLHYAAKLGSDEVVKALIEHGAYPLILDKKRSSPLEYAYRYRYFAFGAGCVTCCCF